MAKLSIVAGSTSQSVNVFIQANNVTTGAGLTGLVYNSSGLMAYYTFAGANATAAVISLATLATVTTAYSSGGFIEIDATHMSGLYRLDLPTAVLAASKGRSVTVVLQGFATMAPCVLEIELTGWDNQDGVHGGLTSLPNTAVTTNGSLVTSGTGSDQLSVTSGRIDIGKALGTAVTLDSNNVLNVSAKYLAGTALTGRDIGTSVLLSSGTGTGQISLSSGTVTVGTNNDKTGYALSGTQTFNVTGNITGNLSGSVGSVTGAVGSVTGTVGSVTGAVGSVTGAVGSVTAGVTVTTNNDKTGYSLTQTFPTNFSSLSVDASGRVDIGKILGTASAGAAGYVGLDWSKITNPTATVGLTSTTISSSSNPTAAQVATAVWQDTTAGDFTTSGSIGKSLFTSGVTPGGVGGLFIAGSNAATTVASLTSTGTFTVSDGIVVSRSSSNSPGMSVSGSGTGQGLYILSGSGATGDAVQFIANSTSGTGLTVRGSGNNSGAYVTSGMGSGALSAVFLQGIGTNSNGLRVQGTGTASGLASIALGTGNAVQLSPQSGANGIATDNGNVIEGNVSGSVGSVINGITTNVVLTESYASAGSTATINQLLYEIRALLAEVNVSGTLLTTKKLDGSSTAHTYTLNSSSAPTSITTTT